VRGVPLDELIAATGENAARVFQLRSLLLTPDS
jgi:hypothetical protein